MIRGGGKEKENIYKEKGKTKVERAKNGYKRRKRRKEIEL